MSERSTIGGGGKNRLMRISALALGHDSGIRGGWLCNAGMHASRGVLFRLHLHRFHMLVGESQAFSVSIRY